MIDLHTHTTASDGELTPKELIDLAIKKNISALSITDHDTVDGLKEADNYAKDKNIIFIPGIELKAKSKTGQMHILGFNIDYNNINLQQNLKYLINKRNIRNKEFIEYFKSIGFNVSIEELQKISGGSVISKPHFAKLFLQKGYILDKKTIFSDYFNCKPLCEVEEFVYEPEEIIKMIKEANGIAVLAHPQKLKLNDIDLENKIIELLSYGLEGIECYHSDQTLEEMKKLRIIADKYQLLVTKGSDYHGPIVKPLIHLGTGINNNITNDEEHIILKKVLNKKHISK